MVGIIGLEYNVKTQPNNILDVKKSALMLLNEDICDERKCVEICRSWVFRNEILRVTRVYRILYQDRKQSFPVSFVKMSYIL